MTKITQIDDRSAASAWSPIREYADVIALGAKDSGGIGFEETGGELELYDLQLSSSSSESPKLLGSVKTKSRFASLAWTPGTLGGRYPLGMLAGGMENGTVHIWDPKAVIKGSSDALIASFSQHASGPVKALKFSSLNPAQLASGGSDGKVLIINLDKPNGAVFAPSETDQQRTQITAIAWNTQVAHIVASAAADGSVAVWDLKSRKAWCELRAETAGQAVADLAWNPTQGLHLLTASSDDRNPVIKLWDLRSSTSMPLTTLQGHQQGILSIGWCPHDDHLLLSCGKDNRTILWDLFTLKPVADVPNDISYDSAAFSTGTGTEEMFASGGLASSQQRRYAVQWSPIKRGVASTCSLDRKVQAHSILGLSSGPGVRPPKWMRPASSVSFGFGGSLVSCGATDKVVRMRNIIEQPDLVQLSNEFEVSIASMEVMDYCQTRASQAKDSGEKQLWKFMQAIFDADARQRLLDTLGFDPEEITKAASSYVEEPLTNGVDSMSLEDKPNTTSMSKSTEEMVKKALLVGNFDAAVECCFRTGNLADALILASCGGADLWTKTQQRYFAEQSAKRPFLGTVSAIIHNQLLELVQSSDPKKWHETLAILSTYGSSGEFPTLCIALGDLLEGAGDQQSASLCYMCSLSLESSVRFWRTQLKAANEKNGGLDISALHEFVVKVSIFLMATGAGASLEAEDAALFSTYAQKLAEQGLLVAAAKYSKGNSAESNVLKDRLYRSKASPSCLAAMGGVAPDFPFTFMDIQKSRGPTIVRSAQKHVPAEQPQAVQQQQAYSTQQQQQQQQATTASSYSYAESAQSAATTMAASTTTSADSLLPDWIELQDPSSGRYYYANQSTGEVTWDKPQAAPAPQPVAPAPAAPAPAPAAAARTEMPAAAATPKRSSANLASKYGDGFVTSSSHPELGAQYGNVGTSNPYATDSRPGTAQVHGHGSTQAPVSNNLSPDRIPELKEEYQPIKDCLLSVIEALKDTQLGAVDKRLLTEGEKAVAVMLKRLGRGQISDDIGHKVVSMCGYINSYDFRTAQSVQTGLVNSDWREHKDWLKGTKSLLQLATKKFGQ